MQPYLVSHYIIKTEWIDEISPLKEKIKPFKPLRAVFKMNNSDWSPYTEVTWKPMKFDNCEGDERLGKNLSTIEIPESGLYSLYAHYAWRANLNGNMATYTSIAINNPENGYLEKSFVKHHLIAPRQEEMNGLSRNFLLNKGDKVMVSIYGHPNAEYYLGHFQFEIEKIN